MTWEHQNDVVMAGSSILVMAGPDLPSQRLPSWEQARNPRHTGIGLSHNENQLNLTYY